MTIATSTTHETVNTAAAVRVSPGINVLTVAYFLTAITLIIAILNLVLVSNGAVVPVLVIGLNNTVLLGAGLVVGLDLLRKVQQR